MSQLLNVFFSFFNESSIHNQLTKLSIFPFFICLLESLDHLYEEVLQ